MSSYTNQTQQHVLYYGDKLLLAQMKTASDHMKQAVRPYLHHDVQVITTDGTTYVGKINGVDACHLYLNMTTAPEPPQDYSNLSSNTSYSLSSNYTSLEASSSILPAYFIAPCCSTCGYPMLRSYSNIIVPLVLYELLIITLLAS